MGRNGIFVDAKMFTFTLYNVRILSSTSVYDDANAKFSTSWDGTAQNVASHNIYVT